MPVQIPKVERFAPQAPESVGRLDAGVVDRATPKAQEHASLLGLGEQGIALYEQHRKIDAKNKGELAAQELDKYSAEELTKTRIDQGDPTKSYALFKDNIAKKQQEILERYKDADELTSAHVDQNLRATNQKWYDRSQTTYVEQYTKYTSDTADASAKIAQNDMALSSSAVKAGDLKSLKGIEDSILKIGDVRKTQGEQSGTAVTQPDGSVKFAPSLQMKKFKDISDGLVNTIEVLNGSKRPEDAKFVYDSYKTRIEPHKQGDLEEKIIKAQEDKQGVEAYAKVRGMPEDEAIAKLEKIPNENVKKKALAELATNSNHISSLMKQQSDRQQNFLLNTIIEREKNGSPFLDVNQFRNDPVVSAALGKMNFNDRMAIEKVIEKPKKSDPKVYAKAWESFSSGKYEGMKIEDFMKMTSGLNPADYSKQENLWKNANDPNKVDKYKEYKLIHNNMTDELKILKLLPPSGPLDVKQIEIRNKAEAMLDTEIKKISDQKPSVEEQQKIAKDIAHRIFAQKPKSFFEEFGFSRRQIFEDESSYFKNEGMPEVEQPKGSTTPVEKTQLTPELSFDAIPPKVRKKYIMEYSKTNNSTPTAAQLLKFIADQEKSVWR